MITNVIFFKNLKVKEWNIYVKEYFLFFFFLIIIYYDVLYFTIIYFIIITLKLEMILLNK